MKVFDRNEKVNFVDENNVLVGYDIEQDCCEHADWFIADKPTEQLVERDGIPDLDGWVFDPSYFKEVASAVDYDEDNDLAGKGFNALDAGGMVVFRMTRNSEEQFLHLFNCHNGYYGHGFTVTINGNKTRDGIL